MRTKNQIRAAKSKGNQFEYDVCFNLLKIYPNLYCTKERGFVRQFDICSDIEKIAIECKNHKKLSWNEKKKYLFKLQEMAPEGYICFLISKTIRQPPLIMYELDGILYECEIEDKFGIKFEKHQPIKRK